MGSKLLDNPPKDGVGGETRTGLAVVIVGMHRSGTSALAGVLNKLGVAAPLDLIAPDQHNARGYFEPQSIIDFHEALFAKLGSPSNDPLPIGYDWVDSPLGEAAADELAGLLDAEFGAELMCLFKDPRICRLAPVWTKAFQRSGRAGVAVLPGRHPLEVAGSLQAKAGLSRAYSLFMWLQHVVLGERFTRSMRRSFTLYDSLMADWRGVATKLGSELGVVWPRDLARAGVEIDAFLSGELRHHRAQTLVLSPADPLDSLCQRVWDLYPRFEADPYDKAAMAEMDAIWAEFLSKLGVFAPLVASFRRDLDGVRGELDKTLREVDGLIRRGEADIAARDRKIAELDKARETLRARLARQEQDLDWAREALNARDAELGPLRALAHNATERLHAIEHSTSWKLATAVRRPFERHPALRRMIRGGLTLGWWIATFQVGRKLSQRSRALAGAAPAPLAAAPAPAVAAAPVASDGDAPAQPFVVFLSGEAHTPGHAYRIARYAAAAEAAGARVVVTRREDAKAHLEDYARADLLFIWRAHWDEFVEAAIGAARSGGAKIHFDVDDLLMEPDLAKSEVIDGIRSQKFKEADVRHHFGLMEKTFLAADYCSAPTEFLAHRLRRHGHPAFVLPNGFDDEVWQTSRAAARRRRLQPSDGLVRIGYATGSKTHQKDFAVAAEAVAQVLREHPEARLVLFRSKWGDVLDAGEFEAFDGLADQIEWRDMVPIQQLPEEVARFDVNLAPLELGNIFCESKSELKYFEAALVDVPTVASPTGPFARSIREGETGYLATTTDEWYRAIKALVADPALRRSVAAKAQADILWPYGPERRVELMTSLIEQAVGRGRRAARAYELDLDRKARPRKPLPHVPDHQTVFEIDQGRPSQATVVVPLYNYARFVVEALDSVAAQTLADIDLVVVDDGSTDDSLEVARTWFEANGGRFNRALLLRNVKNSGLGFTRNVAFANADTPFVLPLDADNRLLPDCLERLTAEIRKTGATFAYSRLRHFGDVEPVDRGFDYEPARFVIANYIDAMALVRRGAWAAVGGYDHVRFGWEDFDFWCRLVEEGMFGAFIPDALCEYRVHGSSMLRSETDERSNKLKLIADIERRHPWLHIDRAPPGGLKLTDDPLA